MSSLTGPQPTPPLPDDAALQAVERTTVQVVQAATRLVADRYGQRPHIQAQVQVKDDPDASLVTETDHLVEAQVAAAVAERFPTHAVLGEEGHDPDPAAAWVWVVDPVDGTTNFVRGLPLFGVSVGVLHHGRPVVGVVGLPCSGEVLHARRGGGAWLDGHRLGVAEGGWGAAGLMGIASREFWQEFQAAAAVGRRLGESRWLGSTAYELAMVATGRIDYGAIHSSAVWDVAAGVCLVREAGGVVLRYDHQQEGWRRLERFAAPGAAGLRGWNEPLLAGPPAVVRELAAGLVPRQLPPR